MKILKLILKLIALGVLLLFSLTAGLATLTSAPWVPSRKKDLKRIKDVLKIKSSDTIYELGCGDGRLCSYLAQHSPAKKIVGIELSFFYYLIAKMKMYSQDLSQTLDITWGNFFNKNIRNANKVFFYLTSRTANKLSKKLLHELKKGSMIVSYQYPISGWEYENKYQPSKNDIPIYEYIIGKNIQKVIFDG